MIQIFFRVIFLRWEPPQQLPIFHLLFQGPGRGPFFSGLQGGYSDNTITCCADSNPDPLVHHLGDGFNMFYNVLHGYVLLLILFGLWRLRPNQIKYRKCRIASSLCVIVLLFDWFTSTSITQIRLGKSIEEWQCRQCEEGKGVPSMDSQIFQDIFTCKNPPT